MASLLIVLGKADPGAALRRVLGEVAPAPPDPGALLDLQLEAAAPTDAYLWSVIDGAAVIRLMPGGLHGLEPDLARALSAATGGLVLAMEAARKRDRYLLGAFLAGRTLELHRCVEGIASGARGRELCNEDAITDAFASWLAPLLGTVAVHDLGGDASDALLATGGAAGGPETPVVRLVYLDRSAEQRVVERPGEFDPARLEGAAAAVGVPGGGAPARWAMVAEDGSVDQGVADGFAALAAALPAWVLEAPARAS